MSGQMLDVLGWSPTVALAAFCGAVVSVLYRPPIAFGGLCTQLAIGTICGNYAGPAAADLCRMPDSSEPFFALLIGLTAMHWLIPAALGLLGMFIAHLRRRLGQELDLDD